MNIEYVTQKIKWYGIDESIESIARLYLLGIGYDDVFVCSKTNTSDKISAKYKSEEFLEVIKVIRSSDSIGMPDLVAVKNGNIIFVEVKRVTENREDSLHQSQLRWIENHPKYKVVVLFLQIDPTDKHNLDSTLQIEEGREEVKRLKDELYALRNSELNAYQTINKLRQEIARNLQELTDKIRNKQLDSDEECKTSR